MNKGNRLGEILNDNGLTKHEIDKITKQIEGIQNTLTFLKWHKKQLENAILSEIPAQSNRLQVPEKDIEIEWGNIPEIFIENIKKTKLDKKIHQFYNVQFLMNIVISKEIGHFISDMYNTLNHIFNLIIFAHPKRIINIAISDELKSLLNNQKYLNGSLSSILNENEKWINEFKDHRKIDEHKSPIEFFIVFKIRPETSVASFSLKNNYTDNEIDLFEIFEYLSNIELFFEDVKSEIQNIMMK